MQPANLYVSPLGFWCMRVRGFWAHSPFCPQSDDPGTYYGFHPGPPYATPDEPCGGLAGVVIVGGAFTLGAAVAAAVAFLWARR